MATPLSPSKPSILKASTGKILQLGSKMGTYILLSDTLTRPSLGMVSFEVRNRRISKTTTFLATFLRSFCQLANETDLLTQAKGMNDILTCFHTEEKLCVGHEGREDTAPAYEVRHLHECISKFCHSQANALSNAQILIGGWLNTKTVIRKRGNIQVAVTKTSKPEAMITKTDFDKYWISIEGDRLAVGKGEPGENKVLSWRDPQPTPGITYVGFGSWHNPVLIKNIKILAPMVTEEKLARRFDPLKVHDWFNQGRFADVLLRTPLDGFEIVAHRAVLFAASRPFEHLVRSAPDGQSMAHLCPVHLLPDTLPGDILQQMLKFIYTGKVVVDEINAPVLTDWATRYELRGLVTICEAFNKDPKKWTGCEMKLHTLMHAQEQQNTSSTTGNSTSSALSSSGGANSSSEPSKSTTPPPTTSESSPSVSIKSPLHELSRDSLRAHDYSRLYQRSLFSDVHFVVKSPPDAPKKLEKTIPVHKIILAMKSEPLGLMFTTSMKESTMKSIEFVEDYEIFELMLRFIYSGNGNFLKTLSIENSLIPLLTMADRFAVYPLRTALSETLGDMIDLDTVCNLLNVAAFYGLTTLRRKSLRFIEMNFSQVTQSEAFLGLEAGPLLEIIFGDDLVVPSERDVFDALMLWGTGVASATPNSTPPSTARNEQHRNFADTFQETFNEEEKATRLLELQQLLSYVRYPLMDITSLQYIAEHSSIVQNTTYLLELVQDAIADKLSQPPSLSMGASGGASSLSSSLTSSNIDFNTSGTPFSPTNSFSALPNFATASSSSFGSLPVFFPGDASSQASPASQSNSTTAAPPSAATQLAQPRKNSGLGAFHTNARKSSAVQFLFSHCGDENGVIYWFATNQGTERWQNPHKVGKIQVSCSSPPSRWTSLPAIVNRTFVTNNFAAGSENAPAWWSVDLGTRYRLMCNYYTLQTDGSANVIGDWELQGSTDKFTWTTLRVHENSRSTFTQGGGKEFAWPVDLALQASPGYRYFRLIVIAPSSSQPHKLGLAGFELYGYLNRTDVGLSPELQRHHVTVDASSSSSSNTASNNISEEKASSDATTSPKA